MSDHTPPTNGSAPTGGSAGADVVAPPTPAAMAALLAECASSGRPVRPIGSGTWTPPAGAGALRVATTALDAILEHEPADLVIGVQAGLRLDRLRAHLTAHGQWLPLDPAAAAGATIGAAIATGSAGPLRELHGTPADLVLGVEVVTGDGRLLRYGGRVVKDVAGYDGVRLFTGSWGSLGIITAVYLRVRALPRADRTWAITTDRPDAGAALRPAVRTVMACDALEPLAAAEADALADLTGLNHRAGYVLLARCTGGTAALEDAGARIRRAAGSAGGRVAELVDGAAPAAWDALARLRAAGPPPDPAPVLPRDAAAATVARRLAAAFDPAGILVPGQALREPATAAINA